MAKTVEVGRHAERRAASRLAVALHGAAVTTAAWLEDVAGLHAWREEAQRPPAAGELDVRLTPARVVVEDVGRVEVGRVARFADREGSEIRMAVTVERDTEPRILPAGVTVQTGEPIEAIILDRTTVRAGDRTWTVEGIGDLVMTAEAERELVGAAEEILRAVVLAGLGLVIEGTD